MPYRVFRCVDCNRPVVPDGRANCIESHLVIANGDGDDRVSVWRHADHERAPEEVPLDAADQRIGDTVRDSAQALCVVTKIEGGRAWGVRVSDLAR